jgi:hypothetical protein
LRALYTKIGLVANWSIRFFKCSINSLGGVFGSDDDAGPLLYV